MLLAPAEAQRYLPQHVTVIIKTAKNQKRPSSFMKRAIIATCFLLMVVVVIIFVKHYQIPLKEAPQQGSPIIERAPSGRKLPESKQVPSAEEPSQIRKHQLQEADRRFLIEQGLQNPINDLVQDLMKHKELIPCKGTLGGTPGFYNPNGITVLSKKRVIADFDDGHVEGTIELTFSVSNGAISWTVLQADCGD